MDYYNFFSFSAKKAIFRASEICSQFNNQFLEPEHIFYSILNLRSCSGVQVLHQLGVNLPKLSYSLEAYLYENAGSFKGSAVFSQRTIALLDLSYKEVKRLHHKEIGTSHLLSALCQERSPFLRQLCDEHGLNARKIRESFLAHLKGYDQGHGNPAATPALQEEKDFSFSKLLDTESTNILRFARRCAEQYRHRELQPLHVLFALCVTARSDIGGFFPRAGVHQGRLLSSVVELLSAMPEGRLESGPDLQEGAALRDLITQAFRSALESGAHGRSRGGQLLILARDLLYAILQDPDPAIQGLLELHGLSPASLQANESSQRPPEVLQEMQQQVEERIAQLEQATRERDAAVLGAALEVQESAGSACAADNAEAAQTPDPGAAPPTRGKSATRADEYPA